MICHSLPQPQQRLDSVSDHFVIKGTVNRLGELSLRCILSVRLDRFILMHANAKVPNNSRCTEKQTKTWRVLLNNGLKIDIKLFCTNGVVRPSVLSHLSHQSCSAFHCLRRAAVLCDTPCLFPSPWPGSVGAFRNAHLYKGRWGCLLPFHDCCKIPKGWESKLLFLGFAVAWSILLNSRELVTISRK